MGKRKNSLTYTNKNKLKRVLFNFILKDMHAKNMMIDIQKLSKDIYYSDKYFDDEFEYRHVMLPKELSKLVPKDHLMSEAEWRAIGVQQSRGWQHYMIHEPGIIFIQEN